MRTPRGWAKAQRAKTEGWPRFVGEDEHGPVASLWYLAWLLLVQRWGFVWGRKVINVKAPMGKRPIVVDTDDPRPVNSR